MSDRNRLLDTAIRIALIAAVWFALVVQLGLLGRPLRYYPETAEQEQQGDYQSESFLRVCATLNTLEDAETAAQCEQAREYADVFAQRDMAGFALSSAWIGLLGLSGLLATVYYARKAWREAQQANTETREQFAIERRPWVQVTARISGPFPDGTEYANRRNLQFRIIYELKNVGQSPAFDVVFHGPLHSKRGDELGLEFAALLRKHKEEIRPQTEVAEMRGGKALFPGQVWPIEDYVASFGDIGESLQDRWIPVLGGIVYYRIVPDGEFHFTPVTWRVVFPAIRIDSCEVDRIKLRDWSYGGLHPD